MEVDTLVVCIVIFIAVLYQITLSKDDIPKSPLMIAQRVLQQLLPAVI